MTLVDFQIRTALGPVTRRGFVFGSWAVHRETQGRDAGHWIVTNLPSGLCCGALTWCWTRNSAIKLAQWCDATFGAREIVEADGKRISEYANVMHRDAVTP